MDENVVNFPTRKAPPKKVDEKKEGVVPGSVSSQWASRVEDRRFDDLESLHEFLKVRSEATWADVYYSNGLQFHPDEKDKTVMSVLLPNQEVAVPTNWSLTQLCGELSMPTAYFLTQASPILTLNLNYELARHRAEMVKVLVTKHEIGSELRAITSPSYRRIMDDEYVAAVMRLLKGSDWKVGLLHASDRYVSMTIYLDEPMDIGVPDLYFPAFILGSSETRAMKPYIEMALIGQDRSRIPIGHNLVFDPAQFTAEKFLSECGAFIHSSMTEGLGWARYKINQLKEIGLPSCGEDQRKELVRRQIPGEMADKMLSLAEPENMWDVARLVTMAAKNNPYHDRRLSDEKLALRLL